MAVYITVTARTGMVGKVFPLQRACIDPCVNLLISITNEQYCTHQAG